MPTRQPRPIDTVISGDVTWTYDPKADKVTRTEAAPAAPLTPTSAELARIYAALQITNP